MYSEGILLKAKIYIVLVQNLRNNKRERSGHLCLGKMFSPTGFGKHLIFQRCGSQERYMYSKC